MSDKGIRKQLKQAYQNASEDCKSDGSFFGGGLSGEGYAGGYRQAISDVGLALSGVHPNGSRY